MTPVIVTPELRSLLPSLGEPLEFRDEKGNLLGRYTPSKPDSSSYAHLDPGISDEEIRERMKDDTGRTLAEILAHLEKHG
jgi:hypothetical protein